MLKRVSNGRLRQYVGFGFVVAYLACIAAVLPTAFRGDRNVQKYLEDGLRKPIGLYLGSVTSPLQTIGCESLGYFGYYSRRKVFDYPGLANPEVVQFERRNPDKRNLIDMLNHFRPDYLVLRPFEYFGGLSRGNLWLRTDYEVVRDDHVPSGAIQALLFPSQNIDLEFLVLRRK